MATNIKFTRREIATALSVSGALLAQAPAPPLPQNPLPNLDDELKAARDSLRESSRQLAQFPLPMSTEPAAHFKA